MGNRVIKFILGSIDKAEKDSDTELTPINNDNFVNYYNNKERLFDKMKDRFARFLLTPQKCLIYDENYMGGIGLPYLPFALTHTFFKYYRAIIKFFRKDNYWRDDAEMEDFIKQYDISTDKQPSYPVQSDFISFEGMEWFINNFDLFDIMTREDNLFVFDTMYLNKYRYKSKAARLGCIAKFYLCENGFKFRSLEYEGNIFTPDNNQSEVRYALRAFYGSISTIQTFASHAVGVHFLSSAKISKTSRDNLEENHPFREILKPPTFMTFTRMGEAFGTLLKQGGPFHNFGPFTYSGMMEMLQDYIEQHKNLTSELDVINVNGLEDYKTWHLSEEETKCYPFNSYNIWIKHIRQHVTNFVVEAIKTHPITCNSSSVDKWLLDICGTIYPDKIDQIIRIISHMYFLQVRHATMSSKELSFIYSRYSYIMRTDIDYKMSYNTQWDHFMKMLVFKDTSKKWILLKTDISNIISDTSLRQIWSTFYSNTASLYIDPRSFLITPDKINCSAGL